jgi:HPt (histidine-containing phosphotransfer) domain-containing protein
MTGFQPERLPHLQNEDGSLNLEFLAELAALFVETTPPKLAELDTALATGDPLAAEKAAHFIKGSCSQIGLEELRLLFAGIETAARQKDLAGAVSLHAGIEQPLARAYAALKERCGAS